MRLRVPLLALCLLGLTACRNRHLAKDQKHQAFEAAAKRYQRDCPSSAIAGDVARTQQCRVEHDQLVYKFQESQATERGDCDGPEASRPAACGSR